MIIPGEMRARQTDFFQSNSDFAPRRYCFGGTLGAGKRKRARPLDTRKPIHIVLKSSQARERLSMLNSRHRLTVAKIIKVWSARFQIKVHEVENMGNHLHIVASFTRKELFRDFLRTITSLVARALTGARKGHPFGGRFWDAPAFTRVLHGRRDFVNMRSYLGKNAVERANGKSARQTVEAFEELIQKTRQEIYKVGRALESG